VATPDLNALKAYSLGQQAYDKADLKSAEAYFNEALRIDPHFALARIDLAKTFSGEDQSAKAFEQIRAAQADRSRLSPRDALYADAFGASFSEPGKSLNKWKLLATVYPDYFSGLSDYAYALKEYANRFRDAISYLEQAISEKNPHRATSNYLLGIVYGEAGEYKDAMQAFSASAKQGSHFQNVFYASVYAAQRNFKEAQTLLTRSKASGTGSFDIIDSAVPIAMAIDQGSWSQANKLLTGAHARADTLGPRVAGRYAGMTLSLQALDGTPAAVRVAALKDYLISEGKALAKADPFDHHELRFQVALTAYLAAHAGDIALARRALAMGGPASDSDMPTLGNLLDVARAEIERASGKPENALAILKKLVNGSELYITHVALMEAYADAHNQAAALTEAQWLSTHRGRAYFESNMQLMLEPFNVAESDLALLRASELSNALGNESDARRSLTEFLHAWPQATNLIWMAARLRRLQSSWEVH